MVASRYTLEGFTLDAERRELARDGVPVTITPQALDLLLFLVRHRERVLSKDDLVAGVWGGRIVSDSTLTTHLNTVRKALGDSGEQQRYIRTFKRKGVRFVGAVHEDGAPALAPPAVAGTDRPSIAVLPFANMSDDPGQEYFADGIAEDITTALSKWRQFLVIARNSAFTYKGRSVAMPQIARELGVRYVLEGSVRKAGGRLRITAQLIDAVADAHVWSERYDGAVDDVFDLQDQISASIVGTMEPRLHAAELERIRHKRPENLAAYDYYLQALPHFYAMTRESNDEARRLLERAVACDARYAVAYAVAAYCHQQRRQQGWAGSPDDEARDGLRLAEAALLHGPDDPAVLWMTSHVISVFAADTRRGRALVERSIALNPNCAHAWGVKGWNHLYAAEGAEGVAAMQRATRLSPVDPMSHYFYSGIAACSMLLGEYETMAQWAERSVQLGARYASNWRFYAAALAYCGRRDDAREAVRRLLALEPDLTVETVARSRANQASERPRQLLLDGLRLAGLPER
jgi:TolB-like protein